MTSKKQPAGLGAVTDVEDIDTTTMTGDVRDLILQEMRDAKDHKPWTERSENDQYDMIDRAERFAERLVTDLVRKLAVRDCPNVPVEIEKWEVGKGLKVVMTAIDSEDNVTALMHGGKFAHVVFTNLDDVRGERGKIKPTPDQAELLHDEDGVVFDNTEAGQQTAADALAAVQA